MHECVAHCLPDVAGGGMHSRGGRTVMRPFAKFPWKLVML